jgi:hypothetical protein
MGSVRVVRAEHSPLEEDRDEKGLPVSGDYQFLCGNGFPTISLEFNRTWRFQWSEWLKDKQDIDFIAGGALRGCRRHG